MKRAREDARKEKHRDADALLTVTPDLEAAQQAISRARTFLLGRQHPDGYWCGFLENDTSCTGCYILLAHYLNLVDRIRCEKASSYLKRTRNEEGGWVQYPGGKSHLDTTLLNYMALTLAGVPEDDPEMSRSRHLIARLGGLEKTNFITRILLAFFGVFPLESLPWVTTRLIDRSGLIYRQGFPRTILIPYMVLYELKAVRDFSHLFPRALALWGMPRKGMKANMLQTVMGAFAILEDPVASVLHQEKCLRWIAERQEANGTWAGIFQVTLFSLMALQAVRDERWRDAIEKGMQGVISGQVEAGGEVIQQFSVSPVMDTAYAVRALRRAGVESGAETIRSAVRWLMAKQSLREGDWKHNNPQGTPGGWSFQFHNTWYPDLDSTSMVLNAMTCLDEEERQPFYPQVDRGLNWLLSMQNRDGGFSVWDKNNWILFRALNVVVEVGDYSHSDLTARAIKSLTNLQNLPRYREREDIRRALRSATRFLWSRCERFRRWYGRWNANYTYGTGQVLEALAAGRIRSSHLLVRPSVSWLARVQNPDGGWGESLESYERQEFVPAPSTVMQTATVLQGLLCIGSEQHEVIRRGIAYLLTAQDPDGRWEDRAFFAVNIPKLWYGRYEFIPTLFAIIALCRYRDLLLEQTARSCAS